MIDTTRLQYVVIHDVSQRWCDPIVSQLFPQIVDLKLVGYGHDYPSGALAVDTTDFVATHVLLTEKTVDDRFELLAGFKWVTLSKCRHYNLDFPPLSFAKAAAAIRHERSLQKIIDRYTGAESRLAYGASWTARPDLRQDRDAAKQLIQLTMAAHLLSVEDMGIASCVSNGVPRMNSDKIEASAGYVLLEDEDGILPTFPVRNLLGEPVVLMHLQQHSEWAHGFAEKYRSLWDQRLTVGTPH